MSVIDFSSLTANDINVKGEVPAGTNSPDAPTSEPVDLSNNTPEPAPAADGVPEIKPIEDTPAPAAEPASDITPIVVDEEPAAQPVKESRPAAPAKFAEFEQVLEDEFVQNMLRYYQKNGDVTEYLRAATTDFKSMGAEQVIKLDLKEQYPSLSESQLDRLYKKQYVDRLNLDAETQDAEDVELGRSLLEAEAEKIRQDRIAKQQQFLRVEPVQGQSEPTVDEAEVQRQQVAEARQRLLSEKQTQSLINDKRVVIQFGDQKFSYEVENPESHIEEAVNPAAFWAKFKNGENIDYDRWYKTSVYSSNPDKYDKALIKLGMNLGRKEVFTEIKNPAPLPTGEQSAQTTTGDFMTDLLKEFAERGQVRRFNG